MTAVEDPRVTANREAVQGAALQLLATHGIAGLTVDRLAEVSGVSRSTIYRRWPDLSVLVVAAFDAVVHEQAAADSALPRDPKQALLAYLRDYARRLNDPVYATVLVVITEWAWRDPSFARKHANTFDQSRSRAMRIVQSGRKAGVFRHDLDAGQAVEDLVAPFFYRRIVQRRRIGEDEVRRLHRRLVHDFTTGESTR
ncbi:TetR/AcrR family transcriptional regulator [Jatrophihabitans fulvus]